MITWRHYLYCFLCHIGKLMISSDWKLSQDYTATVLSVAQPTPPPLSSHTDWPWLVTKVAWIFKQLLALYNLAHKHYSDFRPMLEVLKEVDFFECQSCVSYWKIYRDFLISTNFWIENISREFNLFPFFWWIDLKHFVTTNLQIISRRRDRHLTLMDPLRKS